jgi:anti-anti-sigma regulatory factor
LIKDRRGRAMNMIKLPEDLGIKKVREFINTERTKMDSGPDCVIDFSEVRRIDLSAAQVILALRRECVRKGGNFEIRNANDVTARLLECVGIKESV